MIRHRHHLPIKLLYPALALGAAAVVVPAVVTPAVRLGIPTPLLIALAMVIVAMLMPGLLGRAGRGLSYQTASSHKRHRRCQAKGALSTGMPPPGRPVAPSRA